MQQYREIKARHQDAILFFRMGDFYEMFYDDAETASRVLGLTLTSRNNGGASEVPLAGVPVKAVSDYLRRLVQRGIASPSASRWRIRSSPRASCAARWWRRSRPARRSPTTCSTAAATTFSARCTPSATAWAWPRRTCPRASSCSPRCPGSGSSMRVLSRFAPREIVLARGAPPAAAQPRLDGALLTEREGWEFDPALAAEELARHFGVLSLEGFGLASGGCGGGRAPPAACCAICASCSRPDCRSSRRRGWSDATARCRWTR